MSKAIIELKDYIDSFGYLNEKHVGRRVTVMAEDIKPIITRLKELYYRCMVDRTLREPKYGVTLIPHGIETPSHVINIWPHTSLPTRRLNTIFTGSQMQCLGIDHAKALETELQRISKSGNSFDMVEVLGLYCLNNIDRIESTVIDNGDVYKGISSRHIRDLRQRINEIISIRLHVDRAKEILTEDHVDKDGNVDITDCLTMDPLTRSGFDLIKLRLLLSPDNKYFILSSPGSVARVETKETMNQWSLGEIHKPVKPTTKKSDAVISKVTVKPKKQLPIMTVFNLLSTGASYTNLLKGHYIDSLASIPMLAGVADKIKQVINKDAKKPLIHDHQIMENIVEMFMGLVGTPHNYPITVTITKFEGIDLLKLTPDNQVIGPLYFPVASRPLLSFDKDTVVRELLAGDRSVPTLFSIYVFLLFPNDHDINGGLLKLPELEEIVKDSGINGTQRLAYPLTGLIEKARIAMRTNLFFNEFVTDYQITVYERAGGGYVIQKGTEQVVIKHEHKELSYTPNETEVGQSEKITGKALSDKDNAKSSTVNAFMKWRRKQEEDKRRQNEIEELEAVLGQEDEEPYVIDFDQHNVAFIDDTDADIHPTSDLDCLREIKLAAGLSRQLPKGICTFSECGGHVSPNVDFSVRSDYEGDEINQLPETWVRMGNIKPETAVEKTVETNTQKSDLQKRAKAIAGLFVRRHEHGFEGFGILRHILKDISSKPGFEFALQDVGIHIECTDDIPPQVFAYCFVSEEGKEEDVAVKIDFDLQKDIVDLYVDKE